MVNKIRSNGIDNTKTMDFFRAQIQKYFLVQAWAIVIVIVIGIIYKETIKYIKKKKYNNNKWNETN